MEKTINQVKAAMAAALGLLTGLWGWFGWLVVGWIGCMALDYLTGSMAAAKEGEWSSARAREGIWHKCGMIVVVLVAAGADMLISLVLAHLPLEGADLQGHGPCRPDLGLGLLQGCRRATYSVFLAEKLALSLLGHFHFNHAAAPFFLGNLGLPFLSRLLPFCSQSSQVSMYSR